MGGGGGSLNPISVVKSAGSALSSGAKDIGSGLSSAAKDVGSTASSAAKDVTDEVSRVDVDPIKDLEEVLTNPAGVLEDVDDKLKRLQVFYSKEWETETINKYRLINLKYNNQVVCSK